MSLAETIYEAINSIEVNTIGSIYKLVLSMLLGAVVGYERKRKGQTAGVRTFSLIAMGVTTLLQAIDEMHKGVDNLVHAEDYQCNDDGSYHHDNRALDNLCPGGPGSLVTKFCVRLLYIRK